MSESALNRRRHGPVLHIRDHDLLTARDCRMLIFAALQDHDAAEAARRAERIAAHNALPWWKRAWRGMAFRADGTDGTTNEEGM